MHAVIMEGLRVLARVGVLAEERKLGTWIEVDATVEMSGTSFAGDSIHDTVDYTWVAQTATEIAMEESRTLEHYCDLVAQELLSHDLAVEVEVTARKRTAPCAYAVDAFGVTVSRAKRQR